MRILEKNIKNAFGNRGLKWIHDLPHIIEKLSQYWSLTNITPVKKMSWNFVAFAIQNNCTHVVLKISCDKKIIQDEYRALKHFDGHGVIKVIDINDEYHAMLLEQAIPGLLLKEHCSTKIKDTILIYSNIVKAIASRKLDYSSYTHVSAWCAVIDDIQDSRIKRHFVEKAKQLKLMLLNSSEHEYLCHGDLHIENIIQYGSNWVAIDPKGIVGEMAFEAAAFDLLSDEEMSDHSNISSKIFDRVERLSTSLEIDFDRLLSWIFLRVIISAQWFVEDRGDPSRMLELANHIYSIINTER